ncbi:hypothetical protein BJY01DRAFT_254266 [Aspergillus pseudoustus]|uniref:Cytochrome P450 n=1 Tax=Aspergillus pseudoustus TaxID=1810923 RepID=A0ABR4IUC0_9EURO
MASASDIITYVGVPLAALGVMPIFYTFATVLYVKLLLLYRLRRDDIEAYVESRLMAGIVEAELPILQLKPYDRAAPPYWEGSAYSNISTNSSTVLMAQDDGRPILSKRSIAKLPPGWCLIARMEPGTDGSESGPGRGSSTDQPPLSRRRQDQKFAFGSSESGFGIPTTLDGLASVSKDAAQWKWAGYMHLIAISESGQETSIHIKGVPYLLHVRQDILLMCRAFAITAHLQDETAGGLLFDPAQYFDPQQWPAESALGLAGYASFEAYKKFENYISRSRAKTAQAKNRVPMVGSSVIDTTMKDPEKDIGHALMELISQPKSQLAGPLAFFEYAIFLEKPLMHSVRQCHISTVKLILNSPVARPNAVDESGETPLLSAVKAQSPIVVDGLLNNSEVLVNCQDAVRRTPLVLAALDDLRQGVGLGLQLPFDLSDHDGLIPVPAAADHGDLTIMGDIILE